LQGRFVSEKEEGGPKRTQLGKNMRKENQGLGEIENQAASSQGRKGFAGRQLSRKTSRILRVEESMTGSEKKQSLNTIEQMR